MAQKRIKFIPLTLEKPVEFRPHLAKAIGVNEALIVEVIWAECQRGGRCVRAHAGRLYVHLATRQLARALPCLSDTVLHRARSRLIELGILTQARLRGAGRDPAAWFAVDSAALERTSPLFKASSPLVAAEATLPPMPAAEDPEIPLGKDEPATTNA